MATAAEGSFDPRRTYLRLVDGGEVVRLEVGPDFWERTVQHHQEGRLLFVHHFDRDSPTWERHPEGEEVVYLLSGAIDLVLEVADREEVVPVRAGSAYIVPRGIWHRQVIRTPGDVLFVTPGRGTQHRPVTVETAGRR